MQDFQLQFIIKIIARQGIGQAPARQAAIYAGLELSVPCTTV